MAQHLFKALCHPLFGDRCCPHCSSQITSDLTFFEHLCQQHIDFEVENLGTVLSGDDDSIFLTGRTDSEPFFLIPFILL